MLLIHVRITKLREVRWAEHVTRMGERRNTCTIFAGKCLGNGLVGQPRRGDGKMT